MSVLILMLSLLSFDLCFADEEKPDSKTRDSRTEVADLTQRCLDEMVWSYKQKLESKWIGNKSSEAECEVMRANDPKAKKEGKIDSYGFNDADLLACRLRYPNKKLEASVASLEILNGKKSKQELYFSSMDKCKETSSRSFIIQTGGKDSWTSVAPLGGTTFPVVAKACHLKKLMICETGTHRPQEYEFFE